jgi:hypothetical protein
MAFVLKNPDFGSSLSLVTNTITRNTAGGKLNQARGVAWFKARVYEWQFTLQKTPLDAFLAFAIENAGKLVQITDEYGINRNGVIHSLIRYQQISRGPCPMYKLSFTFEGVAE